MVYLFLIDTALTGSTFPGSFDHIYLSNPLFLPIRVVKFFKTFNMMVIGMLNQAYYWDEFPHGHSVLFFLYSNSIC